MAYANHYFLIHQGPDSAVRASLNDVPFYRFEEPDSVTRSGPAIHLLRPGENELTLEIDRAPAWSHVFVELSVDNDHEHPTLYCEWPKLYAELPEKARRLPLRYTTRFTPEGETFSPVFLASAPMAFDCLGTPELHEAVRAVHSAVARRDLDAYEREMALMVDEHRRAYAGWDDVEQSLSTHEIAGFFAKDVRVRPLEPDKLHYESRAGGRVAHVTRIDGGHVIEAVSVSGGEVLERIRTDLTFTWRDGAWRIFR